MRRNENQEPGYTIERNVLLLDDNTLDNNNSVLNVSFKGLIMQSYKILKNKKFKCNRKNENVDWSDYF